MYKIFIILMVFLLAGCSGENVKETINTNGLSTEKMCWGMRRNPPEKPEFTKEQLAMMDKYGCIYLSCGEEKYLYLTFDEGYENGYTEKILDVLKEKSVPAAFFITGDYFKSSPLLVDRMVREGHVVGNHTMEHPCLPEIEDEACAEKEITSLDMAFYEKYQRHMKYFRPPEGAYSESVLSIAKNAGYTSVFWSFAYDDWYKNGQRGKAYAYEKVIKNLHPGAVILLHAVSKDNAEALSDIIDTARSYGYEFKSLDDYIP